MRAGQPLKRIVFHLKTNGFIVLPHPTLSPRRGLLMFAAFRQIQAGGMVARPSEIFDDAAAQKNSLSYSPSSSSSKNGLLDWWINVPNHPHPRTLRPRPRIFCHRVTEITEGKTRTNDHSGSFCNSVKNFRLFSCGLCVSWFLCVSAVKNPRTRTKSTRMSMIY